MPLLLLLALPFSKEKCLELSRRGEGKEFDILSHNGQNLLGAVLFQCSGRLVQRPARIRHVVHKDCDLVLDIAHEDHAADDVGAGPLLVDERKGDVEAVGHGSCALRAACVGADDDKVVNLEVLGDPLEDGRLGVEVVDRNGEEALDLRRVEVDGDDVVLFVSVSCFLPFPISNAKTVVEWDGAGYWMETYTAGGLQHIRDEARGYGGAALVLLVLARVGEIGDHGGDAAGTGSTAGVDHYQHLHEPVVDVAGGRSLEDEDCGGVSFASTIGHCGSLRLEPPSIC